MMASSSSDKLVDFGSFGPVGDRPPNRAASILQHGVIPGSSQTRARESALQGRRRPASCGLATMESGNGALCRTGRVVETNIDLCGGPVGIGCARGRRRFRSETISVYVRSRAPGAIRIGLETGPTSTWLWTELASGLVGRLLPATRRCRSRTTTKRRFTTAIWQHRRRRF